MNEKLKHQEAFEYYYAMGDSRGYRQVAQKMNASLTSVNKWAQEFGWQEKVQLRDQNNAKKLEIKTDIKVVDDKAKMLNIVRSGINKFIQNLNNGLVDISTVADYERLVKMGLLLQGETQVDDQQKITIEIVK